MDNSTPPIWIALFGLGASWSSGLTRYSFASLASKTRRQGSRDRVSHLPKSLFQKIYEFSSTRRVEIVETRKKKTDRAQRKRPPASEPVPVFASGLRTRVEKTGLSEEEKE